MTFVNLVALACFCTLLLLVYVDIPVGRLIVILKGHQPTVSREGRKTQTDCLAFLEVFANISTTEKLVSNDSLQPKAFGTKSRVRGKTNLFAKGTERTVLAAVAVLSTPASSCAQSGL